MGFVVHSFEQQSAYQEGPKHPLSNPCISLAKLRNLIDRLKAKHSINEWIKPKNRHNNFNRPFREDQIVYPVIIAEPEIEDLAPVPAATALILQEPPVYVVEYPPMQPIHGIFIGGLVTDEAPPAAAVSLVPAYVPTPVENLATNSPAPQLSLFPHTQIGVPPVPLPAPGLLPPFIAIHQRGVVFPYRVPMNFMEDSNANMNSYISEDDDPREEEGQTNEEDAVTMPLPLFGPGLLNILLPEPINLHHRLDYGIGHPPLLSIT